jgi:hypothetical protein
MPGLDLSSPFVAMKYRMLDAAMPAASAAVFGDIYVVDGAYTRRCLELGCERVVLVDSLETAGWQRQRLEHPQLDFYKGDFSNALFMASIAERFDVTVAFDILLHQPPLLHTLHLILDKTAKRICIVQPMLKELDTPNALVYLPGNPQTDLYPLASRSDEFKAFDVHAVNQSNWIWGMTRSFTISALAGEGFEVIAEETGPDLENPRWYWGGFVAERRSEPTGHWSTTRPVPGIYSAWWDEPPAAPTA